MSVSLGSKLQAQAFAVFIGNVLGEQPILNEYDNYIEIEFTPGNKAVFDKMMNDQLFNSIRPGAVTSENPPEIQIKFGDLILPWAMKYVIPAIGLSFFAGRFTKRK